MKMPAVFLTSPGIGRTFAWLVIFLWNLLKPFHTTWEKQSSLWLKNVFIIFLLSKSILSTALQLMSNAKCQKAPASETPVTLLVQGSCIVNEKRHAPSFRTGVFFVDTPDVTPFPALTSVSFAANFSLMDRVFSRHLISNNCAAKTSD